MSLRRHIVAGFLVVAAGFAAADTFRHRQTGEVFHGFATQQQRQGKTLVFVAEENAFKPISLSEYEHTLDTEGRRDMIYVLPLDQPEILLSKVVSDTLAQRISEVSNQGPLLIVLAIDSPGGQGAYMRTVANAVLSTTNCPVVAFIQGEKHGGAYSAAAVVALACEKIYVAPGAVIGSVSPLAGAVQGAAQGVGLRLYSPDHLGSYAAFVASLAERKGQPVVLAKALVDRTIDVVEVEDLDGRKSLIDVKDRSSTQKVLRHLTQVSEPIHGEATGEASSVATPGFVLTLTAGQAQEMGLIDGVVGSVEEIARARGIEGGRIVRSRPVDQAVKQYQGMKRNIEQSLATVERLQARVDDLHQQAAQIEQQVRQGTVEREVRQGDGFYYRSGRDRYNDPYRYYQDRTLRSSRYDRRSGPGRTETLRAEQPVLAPAVAYQQLLLALNDLIREYRRVVNMAERFPGALPLDLTVPMLQQRLDAAVALQNDVRRWVPAGITPARPGY